MTVALTAALCLGQDQHYKFVDIDRFDTPLYQESFTKNQSGGNEWFDLPRSQCLFPRRAAQVQVGSFTNGGTLTLSIGNRKQMVTTTAEMTWTYYLQVNCSLVSPPVNLSNVACFWVDYFTVSAGRTADVFAITVRDKFGQSAGNAYWQGQPRGILFKRSDFQGVVDWTRVTAITFRQDFDAFPNPTTYCVTRFYVNIEPRAVPPAR
ncbi:MAG: hypothetical protein JST30_00010 [Armatimonadetes bacterium]|nr:hypothetical protein [Armatimonadota bacterium]